MTTPGPHHQTALITGASGGIGYELAKLCARDGYHLILVARNQEKLRQLAAELQSAYGVSVRVLAKDLSLPAAPHEIFTELQRSSIAVDLLVNNAGYGTYGFFHQADATTQLNMIQLNVAALTHLTRLFLPPMLARGHGKMLQVASTAAFQPGPLMAVYYATKAYVLSFSNALANELKGTGVTVTALCPGSTRTGFQERAGMGTALRLFRLGVMDAATVARAGYRGMQKGKAIVIPGLMNRLTALSARIVPRNVATCVVRYLQDQRELKT